MKKMLVVLITALLTQVQVNAESGDGFYVREAYGRYSFQDWVLFMKSAEQGNFSTDIKFNVDPETAFEYYKQYLAYEFPGKSIDEIIDATELHQLTSDILAHGHIGYINSDQGLSWGKRLNNNTVYNNGNEKIAAYNGIDYFLPYCGNPYAGIKTSTPTTKKGPKVQFIPPPSGGGEYTLNVNVDVTQKEQGTASVDHTESYLDMYKYMAMTDVVKTYATKKYHSDDGDYDEEETHTKKVVYVMPMNGGGGGYYPEPQQRQRSGNGLAWVSLGLQALGTGFGIYNETRATNAYLKSLHQPFFMGNGYGGGYGNYGYGYSNGPWHGSTNNAGYIGMNPSSSVLYNPSNPGMQSPYHFSNVPGL